MRWTCNQFLEGTGLVCAYQHSNSITLMSESKRQSESQAWLKCSCPNMSKRTCILPGIYWLAVNITKNAFLKKYVMPKLNELASIVEARCSGRVNPGRMFKFALFFAPLLCSNHSQINERPHTNNNKQTELHWVETDSRLMFF